MPARKRDATMHLLTVRVGEVRCCMDLAAVEQVVSLMALNELPGAPPCVKGFFNHGGTNIAVIDLAERLQLPPQPSYTLDTSVVIARAGNRRGGIIVDDIYGIHDCQPDDTGHHEDFQGRQLPFKGTLLTSHGMALWLDMPAVLDVSDALDRPMLDYAPGADVRVAATPRGGAAA
jgi:chemotaxis signal transduction protein